VKIKILGTRGEIESKATKHNNHSGILIDNKLLFDCGEVKFLKNKPSHIFITHNHPDHAVYVIKDFPKTKAKIFAPEKYKNIPITISKTIKIGQYKITPIPTIHSLKVKSNAYLIQKGKKRILYTGDVVWLEKKHHKKLKNLNLVITDGSYIRKGGLVLRKNNKLYGHTGIPNLVNLFKKYTKRIIITHYGEWFFKDRKKAKRKIKELSNEVKVEPTYDGRIITI